MEKACRSAKYGFDVTPSRKPKFRPMAKPTIVIALLLIALGAYGYSQAEPKEGTDKKSPTSNSSILWSANSHLWSPRLES